MTLRVPEGIRLVDLPPYTAPPQLQPAKHLWPLVDEPIVYRYCDTFEDLGAVLDQRCRFLDIIAPHTRCHRSK